MVTLYQQGRIVKFLPIRAREKGADSMVMNRSNTHPLLIYGKYSLLWKDYIIIY